jgi:allantoinase
VWTEVRRRGHTLLDVVRWMAESPAQQVGFTTKGHIALGYAADLAVFTPDQAFVADKATLHHKNPVSAYHGLPLAGVVRSTWLAGTLVESTNPPGGRLLARGNA